MIIERSPEWEEGLIERLENNEWDSWKLYNMSYDVVKNNLIREFTGLKGPKYLPHLTPLAHQLEVAEKVIERMNGKAILADEVGLGKTIEAGLILKEYYSKRTGQKSINLGAGFIITQWIDELNNKFYIPAIRCRKRNTPLEQYDIAVMSMDIAKRSLIWEMIYEQNYDMIIIDEAHKLKNNKTQSYQFVQGLKKNFVVANCYTNSK